MCKHENHMLTGTAEGIHCRGCGAVFHSFEELEAEPQERAQDKSKKRKGDKAKDA